MEKSKCAHSLVCIFCSLSDSEAKRKAFFDNFPDDGDLPMNHAPLQRALSAPLPALVPLPPLVPPAPFSVFSRDVKRAIEEKAVPDKLLLAADVVAPIVLCEHLSEDARAIIELFVHTRQTMCWQPREHGVQPAKEVKEPEKKKRKHTEIEKDLEEPKGTRCKFCKKAQKACDGTQPRCALDCPWCSKRNRHCDGTSSKCWKACANCKGVRYRKCTGAHRHCLKGKKKVDSDKTIVEDL